MKSKWTTERLETFIFSKDSVDHLHRYSIVSDYIKDKIVLDIACGEGYGSNLISEKAKFVYGVDIDDSVIEKATLKYVKENLNFSAGSTSNIPVEANTIDVVVSFETIEHHDEHLEMMKEIKRVLKPNGLLIISTPDKLNYTDKRKFINRFHIKELYKQEFLNLISQNFRNIQLLNQKYINGNSLIQDDNLEQEIQIFSGNYSRTYDLCIDHYYVIAIASNDVFERQNTTIFDGYEIMKMELDNKLNTIFDSNSYKLGHLILFPFKMLKRILK